MFLKQGIAVVCLVLMLTGCATTKEWMPTAGSRADGVVVLSYTRNNFETPTTDDNQGLVLAQTRCKSWGYTSAEPFGGDTQKCTSMIYGTYGGCQLWQVDRQYQCTGKPDK